MHLSFGMPVVDRGGDEAGALERVLIDPASLEVLHLVVRSPHVSEDVLLPMSFVDGRSQDRLLVLLGSDELSNLPRYYEGRTSSPPAGRVDTAVVREPAARRADLDAALAIPATALELAPSTRVTTVDGATGLLAGLATEDNTQRLASLDVDGLGERRTTVPVRYLSALGEGVLALLAQRAQLLDQPLLPPADTYVGHAVGSD